jgi:hypothetical protein
MSTDAVSEFGRYRPEADIFYLWENMTKIKLMADYQCFPLWGVSLDKIGNIDPNDLPISADLKACLLAWATTYNKTLNWDDPVSSGFLTEAAELQFKSDGLDLGKRLEIELGNTYSVQIKI